MKSRPPALRLVTVVVALAFVAGLLTAQVHALTVLLSVRVGAVGGTVTSTGGARFRCTGNCRFTVRQGSTLLLTARPDTSHSFVRWSGNCVGTAPRCLMVAALTSTGASPVVRAIFAPVRRTAAAGIPSKKPKLAEVNVTVSGPGTVTGGPKNHQISCGRASLLSHGCHRSFARGTTLTLQARPKSGHHFQQWLAGQCKKKLKCELHVSGSTLVMAAFKN